MDFLKNRKLLLQIFDLGIRIFTGFMVAVYGLAKPLQFGNEIYDERIVGDLTGMELMWAFFGYSLTVPIVVGVLQVVGSVLLIFKKTKLIGIAILFPILSNIVLFDLVYDVNHGATIYAILFLIFIIVSALIEKEKLKRILATLIHSDINPVKKERYIKMALGLFFGITLFFIFQLILNR